MRAHLVPTARAISPFAELASQLPVLGLPLAELQRRVLAECGLGTDTTASPEQGRLLVGSRCWFTARLLRRFIAQASEQAGADLRGAWPVGYPGARLQVRNEAFQRLTEPLQRLPGPGLHELALAPPGAPDLFDPIPPLPLPLDLQTVPLEGLHPRLPELGMELVQGDEMVFQLDHWLHVQRINLLALGAYGFEQSRRFTEGPWYRRLAAGLGLVGRARSIDPFRIAAAMSHRGPGCTVHPTAVVEASVLGAGVQVGPHAVVRGALVGEGCRIDDHAGVVFSVLGDGVHVTRGAEVNLCVLMDGALVSRCGGLQASVVGRDAFIAQMVTLMDRSFHQEIRVLDEGRPAGTGSCFVGVAVGHRARLGAGVVLGYGTEIPNDASLVMDASKVLRAWPPEGGSTLKQ